MDLINFHEVTTAQDLMDVIPLHENRLFEWKGAGILTDSNRFDKELGKQVSAFANSGGGYLVLGIDDKRNLEPVSTERKKPSRKDWLAGKVRESVDYPLKDFSIHELLSTSHEDKAVFVVEIEDSPAAPHMAVSESRYYYRIEGRTEIARNFYLDLLRSRTTKAKLKLSIEERTFGYDGAGRTELSLNLRFENLSYQCATNWAVIVTSSIPEGEHFKCQGRRLDQKACVGWLSGPVLMPLADAHGSIQIKAMKPQEGRLLDHVNAWLPFSIDLTPVSQNSVGEAVRLEWTNDSELWSLAQNALVTIQSKKVLFAKF